ncbi:MAG: hypothetical protein OXI67_01545 [Candidatus Poribacteria bacterium]|nr:hypothetical protein [Candidatus Poribacteria bacterium]
MNRKTYWGIAALVIILIAAGGFMYWQWSSVQQLKEELAQDNKMLEERDKPVAENKPPVAREGFKMVPHGDHWHEVPIDAPDVWQGEPHEPVAQTYDNPFFEPVSQTYDGPLTFHEELLKTNPVEALRLQAEERGHWSAEWIPPFPADDEEAQTFARNTYLSTYLDDTHPEYHKYAKAQMDQLRELKYKYPSDADSRDIDARRCDLMKITWTVVRFRVHHYDPRTGYEIYPSDYFPSHISDLK